MNDFDDKKLPPELAALGERLSASRPVASEQTLDRVMTRAAQARQGGKKSSLLWSSKAPRIRKRPAMALATLATTVALTGATGLAALFGGAPSVAAASHPSCPAGAISVQISVRPVAFVCATVLPFTNAGRCPRGSLHIDIPTIVDVCVKLV